MEDELSVYEFGNDQEKLDLSISSKLFNVARQDLTSAAANLKVNHQERSYSYGLFRSFFWLLLLDLLLMVLFLGYSAYMSSSASIVQNMVELNLLVTEFWNIHVVMQTALNSAILWKDQATFLRKKPSEVYFRYSQHFKESIIPRFDGLKSKDMGTFSEFYRNITTQDGKMCDLLRKVGKREYRGCGEGQAAFVNNNLVIFLKGLVAIMDQTADTLVMQSNSSNMAAQILANPNFQVYQAYTLVSKLTSDVYYLIMLPLGESLAQYIEDQSAASSSNQAGYTTELETFCYLFIPGLLIYLFLASVIFIRSFARQMYFFWKTPKLLPLGLIERNSMLLYYMKKVESGSKKLLAF